jgi:hypothetical protein
MQGIVWHLLGEHPSTWATPSAPFALVFFFQVKSGKILSPPTSTFQVAGITDVYPHTQLVFLR